MQLAVTKSKIAIFIIKVKAQGHKVIYLGVIMKGFHQ